MRIELKEKWPEAIEKFLKQQIDDVDPASGWWIDDCRYDDEFGIAGEVIQDYDSARHKSIESVIIPLSGFPIPSYDADEPIRTETELMEFIKMVIVDEFPAIEKEEWPDLRMVASFRVIEEYGQKIHRKPARFLEVNFEFEPVYH